jgi:hypothetical protein
MKKIALFVEGYTEQEFVIKIIIEIAGQRGITFEIKRQHKGMIKPVEMRAIDNPEFYILVVNCCNDEQVKSQIIKQYESLSKNGYVNIIGLRDLHPIELNDLPKVEKYLPHNIPTKGAKVDQFIAISETEAWFIEEHDHYSKLHADMTVEEIVNRGFDIINVRAHDLVNPADILKKIYAHWGIVYEKKRDQINKTIEVLSPEEIYLNVRGKAPSLDKLITCIEQVLFTP